MNKRGYLVLTALCLLCTGLGMSGAGWFSGAHAGRHGGSRSHASAQAASMTESAWRYRRSQPVHWRAMVLQQ
jgi:hypothetical protein